MRKEDLHFMRNAPSRKWCYDFCNYNTIRGIFPVFYFNSLFFFKNTVGGGFKDAYAFASTWFTLLYDDNAIEVCGETVLKKSAFAAFMSCSFAAL